MFINYDKGIIYELLRYCIVLHLLYRNDEFL
jgi:hypothetical protein